MKHRNKTKNAIKESTDSPKDKKDRDESADQKRQREAEEDTNETFETSGITCGFQKLFIPMSPSDKWTPWPYLPIQHNQSFCMPKQHNAPFLSSRKDEQTPASTSTTFSPPAPVFYFGNFSSPVFLSASLKDKETLASISTTFSPPTLHWFNKISPESTLAKPSRINVEQSSTPLPLYQSLSTLQDSAWSTTDNRRRGGSGFFTRPSCSQSNIPPVAGYPECSQEETLEEDTSRISFLWIENKPGEADPRVMTEHILPTTTLPYNSDFQFSSTDSCCLTRSHSVPSLTKVPKNNLIRAASSPDMKLKEFTPDISADDFDDETYRFQCSCPGLYQCSVTSLVFVTKGEGDVVYRTVPWNRRLLAQHHKKPAGPLFDIKCQQQSLCQLHLPHCEIISTGGGRFLQVSHVNDEGIEFITPHQITETHAVINITGFSGYGNVKDEESPPDPVRALVLLFYKPPDDPDLTSFLSVLLLPKNVVLRDVLHIRKKLVGDERYIETSPHCKLHPKQVYTLSTDPEDDSVLVQPTEAEFDEECYDNYFPTFQVILERNMKNIKLFIRDSNSSHSVWQRQVYISSSEVKKTCRSVPLNLTPNERLLNVRSCFIDGISGPVLNSLLDKLLEKKVITDAEREEAEEMQNRRNRARFVMDTVRKKGEAASSEMTELLSELDSFFCENLSFK